MSDEFSTTKSDAFLRFSTFAGELGVVGDLGARVAKAIESTP